MSETINLLASKPSMALNSKEGWNDYVNSAGLAKPHLLGLRDFKKLSPAEVEALTKARVQYHSGLPLASTPEINEIFRQAMLVHEANEFAIPTARQAIALSGQQDVGKTCTAISFGRHVHLEALREPQNGRSVRRLCPVCYVFLGGSTTVRGLHQLLANFFAVPYERGESETPLSLRNQKAFFKAETTLLIIDEVHNLKHRFKAKEEIGGQLKFIMNMFPGTVFFVGMHLENTLIHEDPQIKDRLVPLSLAPYPPPEARLVDRADSWRQLLDAIESSLSLYRQHPGDLQRLQEVLHGRTNGQVGKLHRLVKRAAIQAIRSGEEAITEAVLDKVAG